jgi:hypothetical protein
MADSTPSPSSKCRCTLRFCTRITCLPCFIESRASNALSHVVALIAALESVKRCRLSAEFVLCQGQLLSPAEMHVLLPSCRRFSSLPPFMGSCTSTASSMTRFMNSSNPWEVFELVLPQSDHNSGANPYFAFNPNCCLLVKPYRHR